MHFDVLFSIPLGIYTIFFVFVYPSLCIALMTTTQSMNNKMQHTKTEWKIYRAIRFIYYPQFYVRYKHNFPFYVLVFKCVSAMRIIRMCAYVWEYPAQSRKARANRRPFECGCFCCFFFFGRGKVKYHKLTETTVFGITSTQPTIVLHRTFESK